MLRSRSVIAAFPKLFVAYERRTHRVVELKISTHKFTLIIFYIGIPLPEQITHLTNCAHHFAIPFLHLRAKRHLVTHGRPYLGRPNS